jgi:hypothetical protein
MLAGNSNNSIFAAALARFGGSVETENGSEPVPGNLMAAFLDIGGFVRSLRIQARCGQLSRAPLRLLRVELRGEIAECDWMARPADAWDEQLPRHLREQNEAEQALVDALAIRDLIFCALPSVSIATVRVFRESAENGPGMIIRGIVSREQAVPRSVQSLAMRAKLCGLQFVLEDGVLMSSENEVCALNY